LQRLPPRQRAALLLKDVLGWSADDIAEALEMSVPSVNSALHRAREGMARAGAAADEPPPEVLREYVRAWEARDLHGLVALLRKDIVFAMPPHAAWFRGSDAVARFVQQPRFQAFWSSGLRVVLTRANGLPTLAFYRRDANGVHVRHSIGVTRFIAGQVAESTVFIGPGYFAGFDLPGTADRTVSVASAVMEGKGGPP
jgi:RNA polymerase sigma-70 factor (ECF subfamily)